MVLEFNEIIFFKHCEAFEWLKLSRCWGSPHTSVQGLSIFLSNLFFEKILHYGSMKISIMFQISDCPLTSQLKIYFFLSVINYFGDG